MSAVDPGRMLVSTTPGCPTRWGNAGGNGIPLSNNYTRKFLVFGLKWGLGLLILAILLRRLDIAKLQWAMASTDLELLGVGLIAALCGRLLLAWQTERVVTAVNVPLTIKRAFGVNLATAFYSLVLPGDLSTGAVRWYKLSRPTGQGTEIFAAIVFQRLVNTLLIVCLGLIALLIDHPFARGELLWPVLLVTSGSVALVAMILSRRVGDTVEGVIMLALGKAPASFQTRATKILSVFVSYRFVPKRTLMLIILLSVGDTLLSILLFVATSKALNLALPVLTLIWIRSLVLLIQLVPLSISGLGLREGALVFLLPNYGVADETALCFSLILFSYTLLFGLLGGVLESWGALKTSN